MSRLPLARALAASLLAGMSATAAPAQDAFNPFAEPETSRPRPKQPAGPAVSPEPQKPLLAPMDGRIPQHGTWSAAPQPPSAPGEYGTPYAPAPGSGASHEIAPAAPQQPGPQAVVREPPSSPASASPPAPPASGIERSELSPVMAGGDTGLPFELWRGLTVNEIEALFASLEIPPRSPALHLLWMRLIAADAGSPSGGELDSRMLALRAEALDRSGDPRAARDLLARQTQAADPVAQLIEARTSLELGEREAGCSAAKALAGSSAEMPKRLKAEAIVLAGYCAAAGGNHAGAGIAAELARENGMDDASGPAMLDALAMGNRPELPQGRRIGLVELGMMELAGGADRAAVMASASPSLLAFLARDSRADPAMRLAAAEAAAAVNAIKPADLATAYRADGAAAGGAEPGGSDPSHGQSMGSDPRGLTPNDRAALFRAIEAERTPQKKTRQIRAFLDSARRAQVYWPALLVMAEALRTLEPAPEIGWFAETAVEIALVSGDHERARAWIAAAAQANALQGNLDHWLALIDIAAATDGSGRAAHLDSVERLALTGRFDPVLLHRLATVLDALGTHIPVPLWEAASRTPQPAGGHLPDTGVLTALLEASKRKEFGHTVLLAMQALGPAGAEGAHLIALGDSIRALKRAGLETEARSLSLEALFAGWPRAGA